VVTIYGSNNECVLSSDAVEFRSQVALVLQSMREELDDHRLAINEDTQELDATNESLNALGKRLDKLTERVDELTMLVKGEQKKESFDVRPLSAKEKEVFHALYVLTESQPFASYEQLARKSLMTKELVAFHVTGLIRKGVPVLKKHDAGRLFLRLDPQFRECQVKKNVVGLNAPLTCWIG